MESQILKCGECVPETDGDEMFTKNTKKSNISVEYCTQTHNHVAICQKVGFTPTTMYQSFCKENEFCTSKGNITKFHNIKVKY